MWPKIVDAYKGYAGYAQKTDLWAVMTEGAEIQLSNSARSHVARGAA